ncbi:hypothetical protein SISSUDRAFT_773965 [Sistotremastrum suecicum HHB10207 ss-3]|uniref:DUF6699 domain-containing protein n=1 Tax=Sistotremastrum suecicum HHB10207 ss-3 TaxID=1314776 RepID=A0A166D821_9AGAM|nr:hypothetical protein SISSUDRAFT_773965 [Sistotremastrum suecicum HHB10207 ss-3]
MTPSRVHPDDETRASGATRAPPTSSQSHSTLNPSSPLHTGTTTQDTIQVHISHPTSNPPPYRPYRPYPPALHPSGTHVDPAWQNAYRYYYPQGTPYGNGVMLHSDTSPYRGTISLPSPRASPYSRPTLLPEDTNPFAWIESVPEPERSWTDRMRDWFSGRNNQLDTHEEFYRDIALHRCLDRRGELLQWNISHPPFTVWMNNAPDPHTSAFDPELSSARIICELFPWVIDVKAPPTHGYITVMSLLGDIYHSLRKGIGREAYESFSPRFKEQMKEAYYRRCYSIPDEAAWDANLRGGLKRVDFTLNRKTFGGLVQVSNMMMTFELKLLPA